jgi:hypothetical protein
MNVLSRLRYSSRFGPLWAKVQWWDDIDWRRYTRSYPSELVRLASDHTVLLRDVSFRVIEGRIVIEGKSLHPNHALIYQTALALRPASIYECGVGGCDHLVNLHTLLPEAEIAGGDRSLEQLAFARSRHDLRWARIEVRDLTLLHPERGVADLVFTQAVLMHIHGGDRHRTFLRNMWQLSRRYVLLMENWLRHDFVDDLRALFPGQKLYLLRDRSAKGLLLDKQNALDYPTVTSDRELR